MIRWFLVLMLAVGLCHARSERFHMEERLLNSAQQRYGERARLRLKAWSQLLNARENLGKSDQEKLELVNRFFNQMEFLPDETHWGKKDYWATPVEFIASNGGDCEDFSIAKYFTLRALGVSDARLRITYVKALSLGAPHMVLSYYETPGSVPLVLDNLDPVIRPGTEREDLIPVYSFNSKDLWLAKLRGSGRSAGGSDRLSLWKDLLGRVNRETGLP